MPTTAKTVLTNCATALQDAGFTRWTVADLIADLNDGQRAIVTLRPDANIVREPITLVAGSKQALPSNAIVLKEITKNTSSGRAINIVDRAELDAFDRSWHGRSQQSTIKHYSYEIKEPMVFWVYPPAVSGTKVDAAYPAMVSDVSTPTSGLIDDVTGNVNFGDVFVNALRHFILMRSFERDSEYSTQGEKVTYHRQCIAEELGVELKSVSSIVQNPINKPTVPAV